MGHLCDLGLFKDFVELQGPRPGRHAVLLASGILLERAMICVLFAETFLSLLFWLCLHVAIAVGGFNGVTLMFNVRFS